jgi:hypothetical protein
MADVPSTRARIDKDIGVVPYQQAIQTAFREVADGIGCAGNV